MRARLTWLTGAVLLAGGTAGCGPYLHSVDDGVYGALVPTAAQLADERSDAIPGGFAALVADGADRVVARIDGDTVMFELDGETVATRTVAERRDVRDSEGSGPFKAETQVLALGEDPLVLGSLRITDPVIWFSGGDEDSDVIAVKPWDPDERGPIVQCTAADEQCLELPVGETLLGDPIGEYMDMNMPDSGENPLAGIQLTATDIVFTLDTGEQVRTSRDDEFLVRACAFWESAVWPVPAEVGVAFDDPVLVETSCPLPAGEAHSLTVMERTALPVLAPLAPERAGEWCHPGPTCLWFLDEMQDEMQSDG